MDNKGVSKYKWTRPFQRCYEVLSASLLPTKMHDFRSVSGSESKCMFTGGEIGFDSPENFPWGFISREARSVREKLQSAGSFLCFPLQMRGAGGTRSTRRPRSWSSAVQMSQQSVLDLGWARILSITRPVFSETLQCMRLRRDGEGEKLTATLILKASQWPERMCAHGDSRHSPEASSWNLPNNASVHKAYRNMFSLHILIACIHVYSPLQFSQPT